MPVTQQRQETSWLIKLEGQITVSSAAELKELLLEWVSSGLDLELDLERADEIDITIMQLLWSASQRGGRVAARLSSAAAMAANEVGFAQLPGFPAGD